MSKVLVDRIIAELGGATLDSAGVTGFIAEPGPGILFFAGDADQRPESGDAAVVLRELQRLADGALRVARVAPGSEKAAMAECAVLILPTLVFIQNGTIVSRISRIADWPVYLDQLTSLGLTPKAA